MHSHSTVPLDGWNGGICGWPLLTNTTKYSVYAAVTIVIRTILASFAHYFSVLMLRQIILPLIKTIAIRELPSLWPFKEIAGPFAGSPKRCCSTHLRWR